MQEQEINEIVEKELLEIVTGNYHTIKMDGMEMRLFKSLSNARVEDETFDEYKVRLKINKKLVKAHKNGVKQK